MFLQPPLSQWNIMNILFNELVYTLCSLKIALMVKPHYIQSRSNVYMQSLLPMISTALCDGTSGTHTTLPKTFMKFVSNQNLWCFFWKCHQICCLKNIYTIYIHTYSISGKMSLGYLYSWSLDMQLLWNCLKWLAWLDQINNALFRLMLSSLDFPMVVFVAESTGCIEQAPFIMGPESHQPLSIIITQKTLRDHATKKM